MSTLLAQCMLTLFALVRCYDTMLGVSAQACPLDKKNRKEGL